MGRRARWHSPLGWKQHGVAFGSPLGQEPRKAHLCYLRPGRFLQMDYCNTLYVGLPLKSIRETAGAKWGGEDIYVHPEISTRYPSVPQTTWVASLLPDSRQGAGHDLESPRDHGAAYVSPSHQPQRCSIRRDPREELFLPQHRPSGRSLPRSEGGSSLTGLLGRV